MCLCIARLQGLAFFIPTGTILRGVAVSVIVMPFFILERKTTRTLVFIYTRKFIINKATKLTNLLLLQKLGQQRLLCDTHALAHAFLQLRSAGRRNQGCGAHHHSRTESDRRGRDVVVVLFFFLMVVSSNWRHQRPASGDAPGRGRKCLRHHLGGG